jgi:hypothetical protein
LCYVVLSNLQVSFPGLIVIDSTINGGSFQLCGRRDPASFFFFSVNFLLHIVRIQQQLRVELRASPEVSSITSP